MGLLATGSQGLLAGIELPSELLFAFDIKRSIKSQGAIGGTSMDFDHAEMIVPGVMMAIQSMQPAEIELWKQRGVNVSHKCYTTQNLTAVLLGDVVFDSRFIPARKYVVSWTEDMGGAQAMWGVFCKLL